jgi:hypothetical protein
MDRSGITSLYQPQRGGSFDTFATGSDALIQMMREARDPRYYSELRDEFLDADTFASPYFAEYPLKEAREDVGAPPRTEPGSEFFGSPSRLEPELDLQFDAANIRDMMQFLEYLESTPDAQLSERDRALRDEIPFYLSRRTGV